MHTQNLPNAQLILYPDANHGSLFQYPNLFVSQADQFLTSALQGNEANLQASERLPFPSIVSAAGNSASTATVSGGTGRLGDAHRQVASDLEGGRDQPPNDAHS
jgi:hypothetical protein